MNKIIGSLFVATGLLAIVPVASACPGGMHHGGKDACPKGGGFFQQMDKNGDGAVSRKEFDAFHAAHFKEIDANKDGKISQDEMAALHGKMMGMGRQTYEQRFDESDINHDGALSKEEAEIGMPMLFAHFDEADANKDGKLTKEEINATREKHREEGHGMMKPVQP